MPSNKNNSHLSEMELKEAARAITGNGHARLNESQIAHLEDCWLCQVKVGARTNIASNKKALSFKLIPNKAGFLKLPPLSDLVLGKRQASVS